MFWINIPIAIGAFVVLALLTWLLYSLKQGGFKSPFNFKLLFEFCSYFVLSILLQLLIFFLFKKTSYWNMLWLYLSLYIITLVIRPYDLYLLIKHKSEDKLIDKKRIFGMSFLIFLCLEVFAFNNKAYQRYDVVSYDNFVNENIVSNGEVNENKIVLKNKQFIIINNYAYHDNLHIGFQNSDMNLYINIFTKSGETGYSFYKCYFIDPKYDAFSYLSTSEIKENVTSLKIEFDIDSSRYLNDDSKPLIVVNKLELDSNFPLTINPVRLGLFSVGMLLILNFKKWFIDNDDEQVSNIKRVEKVVLLCGAIFIVLFFIYALINHNIYFIKYDELYLGGTSSNNIYYQQFDAYVKGQLNIDRAVDPKLLDLANPYDPAARRGITYLWDHAFYNGKYYSYYGHSPIYLVMFPIYWVSGHVPSNMFILQFGVLLSVFTFLLAGIALIKLFVNNPKTPLVVLALGAMLFGSLLFTNNTYEYGGMVYRIPYAYANCFLFLTIYLFIKGYQNEKKRIIYMGFAGLSLVFIVFSRPIQLIYLLLLVPLFVKLIIDGWTNKKKILLDFLPAVIVVLIGAIIVCVMNYVRFGSILEFGEHYQLTVNDPATNKLSWAGIPPTFYHFYTEAPQQVADSYILSYRSGATSSDVHPYIVSSVGLFFVPVSLFLLFIPLIIKKKEPLPFNIFVGLTPFLVFFVSWFSYCFAGVCPRYLGDFFPVAALVGGLVALKLVDDYQKEIPVIAPGISIIFIVSIVLTFQYHFLAFDGYRVGDAWGLYSILKSIINRFNI